MAKGNAKANAQGGRTAAAVEHRVKQKAAGRGNGREFEHHRVDEHDSHAPAGP
jgi:hypothetical protein